MKYGAKMIAESTLEAVPNDNPERDYDIEFTIPEFTCLCPQSNFPDFATIRIRYVPDHKLVELKSLKLYINKFLLDPRFMEVVGDFNVRGNIKTVVTARHTQKGYSPNGASRGGQ